MQTQSTIDMKANQSTGVKAKVENKDQYQQYLQSLDGLRQELGVALREELYPQEE